MIFKEVTDNMKNDLERGAGLLLAISSLPSKYGIGTFGKAGYDFVDILQKVRHKYWQVLPLGPTSYGDSPYQSFSAFAGNPYFIDLDMLIEEELLDKDDVDGIDWGDNESYVDYEKIYENRFKILKKACSKSNHYNKNTYKEFCNDNKYWLDDYSLYMSLKEHFDNEEWLKWPEDIRFRENTAIEHYTKELKNQINFWKFCQFKFFEQWNKLKKYANEKNVQIIGDIPLYVSLDSADVWVNSRLFDLDERKKPINVAGVPPDCFSQDGQRWGNPLYDWDIMEKEDFLWWRKRMESLAKLYDVIRIDHFIGIVKYYTIPATCTTAKEGEYKKGPAKKLLDAINESVGDKKIIAEDLGVPVPEVKKLMKQVGYPGMKILQFAFGSGPDNDFLPHNYTQNNQVIYGGTHDNETLVGFFKALSSDEIKYAYEYTNTDNIDALVDEIIRMAYMNPSNVVIFQVQDILKLDNSARMNEPSTLGCNWKWRMKKNELKNKDLDKLNWLTCIYKR